MTRAARLLLLLVGATLAAQPPRATVILPVDRPPIWMDTTEQARSFAGPRDRVFAAVDNAQPLLGIPPGIRAPASGVVGTGRLKTQRRPADVHQVSPALLGMVRLQQADAVDVRLAFAAGAQDFSGPRGDPISCSSTGALEERLLNTVAAHLMHL